MSIPKIQSSVVPRAEAFLRSHFDFLNMGKREEAKAQLFFPAHMRASPLEVYLDSAAKLVPLAIESLSVSHIREVRNGNPAKPKGPFATISFDVSVRCSRGVGDASFNIWWFPNPNELLIAERPAWIDWAGLAGPR